MKKVITFVLLITVILSALCTAAYAASPQDGAKAKKTIAVIGDSIASGYMLSDYDPDISRPRSGSSFTSLLAKELGYGLVDMTKEGTTTKNVVQNQFAEKYKEYVFDAGTLEILKDKNGEDRTYTFDNRDNLKKMKTADIIALCVGMGDLDVLFSLEREIVTQFQAGILSNIEDLSDFIDTLSGKIDTKTTEIARNLEAVFTRIRALNPTATIAYQNLYNPYEQVDISPLKEFSRSLVRTLNSKTKDVCKNMNVVYVDVYETFAFRAGENLINMDCPSLRDYTNGNYQKDMNPTALGHKYIKDVYVKALENADALPTYLGHDVESSYTFTRNEMARGINKLLPNTVAIKTTHGDYSVKVKNWKLNAEVVFNTSLSQILLATAELDVSTVPQFIRDMKKITTVVTVTGTFDPEAVETDPETAPETKPSAPETKPPKPNVTKPAEDTKKPSEDIETDIALGTDTLDTGDTLNGTDVTLDEVTTPEEDTGVPSDTAEADTDEQTQKDEYDDGNGRRNMIIFAVIGVVLLVGVTSVVIYFKKTRV